MKKLRKISGSDVRLLLAAVLCLAVLLATDDSGACGETGKINVQNNSDFSVNVKFSGPQSTSVNLGGGGSTSLSVKVGTYQWVAVETGIIGGQSISGSCKVTKDVPGSVVINF
jgi:secreted protein with Ig-like and vWFA domain